MKGLLVPWKVAPRTKRIGERTQAVEHGADFLSGVNPVDWSSGQDSSPSLSELRNK